MINVRPDRSYESIYGLETTELLNLEHPITLLYRCVNIERFIPRDCESLNFFFCQRLCCVSGFVHVLLHFSPPVPPIGGIFKAEPPSGIDADSAPTSSRALLCHHATIFSMSCGPCHTIARQVHEAKHDQHDNTDAQVQGHV